MPRPILQPKSKHLFVSAGFAFVTGGTMLILTADQPLPTPYRIILVTMWIFVSGLAVAEGYDP